MSTYMQHINTVCVTLTLFYDSTILFTLYSYLISL